MTNDSPAQHLRDLIARGLATAVGSPRCPHTAEKLRTYSYKIERLSGDILPDLVDKANHTIGAIRYALLPLYRKCTTGMLEYYREQYEAARATREGIG
jgi:phage terminase large subunit